MRRLTDAVAYMHQNSESASHRYLASFERSLLPLSDMVHRDLKLENILLRGRNDDSDDSFDIKVSSRDKLDSASYNTRRQINIY